MNTEPNFPLTTVEVPDGLDLITLGAGCFWCTEAVFQRLEGVEICPGTTGHAEVVNVYFDPKKISLESLLEVFWATHDPTTLNRQGGDVGPQYRSAIFYHSEQQKQIASLLKDEVNARNVFDQPIVTEITPFTNFYPAEDYHQEYFNLNGMQPYCQFVVKPKVDKLKKYFAERLK